MATSNVIKAQFGNRQIQNPAAYDAAVSRRIVENAQKTWRATFERASEVESFLMAEVQKENCSSFYTSLWNGLNTYGKLSDKQMIPVLAAIDKFKAKREEWQAQRDEKAAGSNHVGVVKQRIVFPNVKVEFVADFMGTDFNDQPITKYVYTFRDESGNALVWITENGRFADKGETLSIKGTVKAHKDYKGEKQTMVNRVVAV